MNIKELKNSTWQQLKQLIKPSVSSKPIMEKQPKTVEVQQASVISSIKEKPIKPKAIKPIDSVEE